MVAVVDGLLVVVLLDAVALGLGGHLFLFVFGYK